MYLRYGDPSWDSPETADAAQGAADGSARPSRRRGGSRTARSAAADRLPVVELDGVDLHCITEPQAVAHVMAELDAGRGGVVVTPNLDHLRRCRSDVHFEALVAEADLVVADGMPLVW